MRRTQEELNEQIILFKVHKTNDKWYGYRQCPTCNVEIRYEAQESYYVLRNIRKAIADNTKCLKCSVSGENNPFYGKKHSEKTKAQVSKSRTGKACGQDNAMANPIHRKKATTNLKARYDSGELDYVREMNRERMIQSIKDGKLHKSLPTSKPELEIIDFFKNLGLSVTPQFRIDTLKYDVYVQQFNLLIEFNGDYWHMNPIKYSSNDFNDKKNMYAYEIWSRDEIKKNLALKSGYRFLTIWENDFKKNKQNILNNLKNYE